MTDMLPPNHAYNVTIPAQSFKGGTISIGDNLLQIDLKTGHVKLAPGMTPDGGAKAFWKAVGEMAERQTCWPKDDTEMINALRSSVNTMSRHAANQNKIAAFLSAVVAILATRLLILSLWK